MKHIFFAFPTGLAGAALLLLRSSVVLFLLTMPSPEASIESWSRLLVCLAAAALALGFRARAAAGVCVLVCLARVWPFSTGGSLQGLTHALDAAALAMIGPGAFSVDAHLFGRRTLHLPR